MSSPLLTCPLCSQPGFQTLDSLRYGLISAATRQVVCPVCHDILFGLDKFTIHLFSHTVQHQQEMNTSSLPSHLSNISWTAVPLSQPSNNLLICTQPDLNPKMINVKEFPIARQNITTNSDRSSLQTVQESLPLDTMRKNAVDKLKPEYIEEKQNCSVSEQKDKCPEVQQKSLTLEKKEEIDNCKFNSSTPNKEVTLSSIYAENENVSLPAHSRTKPQTVLQSMETSDGSSGESTSSLLGHKSLSKFSIDKGNTDKQNLGNNSVSIQCSTLVSKPTSENNIPTLEKSSRPTVKCNVCGFSFDDSSILAIHYQLVHPFKNSNGTLNQQMQGTNNSKQIRAMDDKNQFPCHLCTKAFKMRGSLMVHLRVAHSSGIGTGKLFTGRLDPECHTEERKFSCHLCSKSFKKDQHLSQHLKTHEGKQWECDVCSKMFTTKYFLKKHKRLHTGETPYSCETCGKTFTFQQSYHKHLLYHSDDKPHVCTECDRAFKELSTLHNHQRIHTGEKPFSCETCGKCFRQRVSYLVHRRIHTGVMPYQCTACGKNFRYKVSQRTHKCPSQPPGVVVRQSGDLVQKLLQGVQQKAASSSSQVPLFDGNKDQENAVEVPQLPTSQGKQDGAYSQFNVTPGNDIQSMFPSNHIVLSYNNSLYNIFSKQESATTPSDDLENKIHLNKLNNSEVTGLMHEEVQKTKSQKLPIMSNSVKVTGLKMNIEEYNDDNTKNTGNEQSKCTAHSRISSNLRSVEEVIFQKKCEDKINNSHSRRNLSPDPVLNVFQASANGDPCLSSNEIWKSSKKSKNLHENSHLTVETTDFFSMVMSPAGKSLPSPSERLQHLSLSSPTDALLNYEDDGMFQFLLSADETPVLIHTDVGKKTETSVRTSAGSPKPGASKGQLTNQRKNANEGGASNNTKMLSNSEPLETINEESLKQLLYGAAKS